MIIITFKTVIDITVLLIFFINSCIYLIYFPYLVGDLTENMVLQTFLTHPCCFRS